MDLLNLISIAFIVFLLFLIFNKKSKKEHFCSNVQNNYYKGTGTINGKSVERTVSKIEKCNVDNITLQKTTATDEKKCIDTCLKYEDNKCKGTVYQTDKSCWLLNANPYTDSYNENKDKKVIAGYTSNSSSVYFIDDLKDLTNALNKISDISQGLYDCQGNYTQSQTTINSLNLSIIDLNNQLSKCNTSISPASSSVSTCNYITICKMKYKSNFIYEQIGCTSKTNVLPQLIQTVKDLDEATDLARTYGATVFALTDKNELYIGFSYDSNDITSTNLCTKDQTIKVYCATPTIQTNPTYYSYPFYCSSKSNSSSDFTKIINTTFNNLDNKYNIGKVTDLSGAIVIANKYGATAFFIDTNSNMYITYNFNKTLIDPTVNTKTPSSSIKETIYYAEFRTDKIQLSHPNCA
jgi:hypothetical protein